MMAWRSGKRFSGCTTVGCGIVTGCSSPRSSRHSATILVSSGQNASIELKAKGTVSDIADLSAGVSAVFASGVQTRIVGEKGLTPLFRAVRVKEAVVADDGG